MDFKPGMSINDIFNELSKKAKMMKEIASESMIKIYNEKSCKTKSVGELLVEVSKSHKMECGCCYKLSAPVMDMMVAELGILQTVRTMAKKTCSDNKKLMEYIDHSERMLGVIFDGILELIKHEFETGSDIYTETMRGYRNKYRRDHPLANGEFDHVLALNDTIEKIVEEYKSNAKTNH